jgi:hypothetical protein
VSNKQKITALVAIIVVLTVLAVYWYIKGYMPKYRWTENYLYNNEQPYGLKLFHDLLSNTHPKGNFIFVDKTPKDFLWKEGSTALYVFIGSNYISDSANSRALANFVKRGNNAFISSFESEHNIFRILTQGKHPVIYYHIFTDSIVNVSFDTLYESRYTFDYMSGKHRGMHNWAGLDSSTIPDSLTNYGFEKVSCVGNRKVDCFRVKYGKGWFVFHFNPILFTNYNLSKEVGYNYINRLFSAYNKPRILWDEFSKSGMMDDKSNPLHETPLRFILAERSLRWSWYLLCALVLLYVIFNSKRKQAYIPLLPKNKNTTIEYINSIAILHHQNNSDEFLADEILKQFLSFVKHKYGISPNMKKKEIPVVLAPLSGVSEDIINNLFEKYMGVKCSTQVENKSLLEFYQLTEYFYQNCK